MESRKRHSFVQKIAVLGIVLLAPMALAYEQPVVNLGATSYLDGIPPAGPGWYLSEYVQLYTADTFADSRGASLPLNTPELTVWASLTQLIFQSDKKCPLTGGDLGLNIILPYVDIDASYGDGMGPQSSGSGFGDLVVGPFWQWVNMGEQGPTFAHRVELQMILPTGKYEDDAQINPGANVFSFNPYWSGTYFMGPKMSVSTRVHYLWNDENSDPAPGPAGAPDTVQAGHATHINFAANRMVSEPLRVGINGYYFKQLSNTEFDGTEVSGTKEQVLGIGPGALYSFSKDAHLFFNVYFETEAENRTEGERYNVRYVHHF